MPLAALTLRRAIALAIALRTIALYTIAVRAKMPPPLEISVAS